MDLSTRDGRHEQGKRIQLAAEQVGLSLAELAKRIGCSRALIYQYVGGQVLAQPDRLQAIANECGRSLAWFYVSEDEPLPAVERDAELERLRAGLEAERAAFERTRSQSVIEHLEALAEAQGGSPDFEGLRRTCERLVERAGDLGDAQLLAEARFQLGNACYALGDLDATRAAMTTAIEAFRELGLVNRERAARQTLGAALAGVGERDRALAEFEAVMAGGGFADEWRARLGRADVYEALGRGEDALDELALAEAAVAEQPEGPQQSWAELFLAGATVNVYLLHDDFSAAVERARRCLPLAEELTCVSQLVEARINLGYGRRRLGEWPDALESYEDAVRLARLTGDRERAATALACRAELLAAMGLHDRARTDGKDALAAALAMGSIRGELLAHLALSETYRRSGDGHEAVYHASQGVAAAAGHGLLKIETTLRLALARGRRLLDEETAVAEDRRAAAVADTIGSRWLRGQAALGLAADALARGKTDEARQEIATASTMAAETGEWELSFDARVMSLDLPDSDASVAENVIRDLLTLRDAMADRGVEESLLDEPHRVEVVRRCLGVLAERGDKAVGAELLESLAWPPLEAELGALLEE